MPRYRWTGVGPFDGDVEPGDEVELAEHVGEPQPEMERIDDEADDDDPTLDLDADGTCEAVKSDGEVCGRELPCPYHGEGG